MSFFSTHHFERESYKNAFDFTNYADELERFGITVDTNEEQIKRSLYKSNHYYDDTHEYVVMWYREQIITHTNADDAVIYVDVLLADLSKPTYEVLDKKTNETITGDSYITVQIPINYLHKMPFGSIWQAGVSKERFVLETFDIQVTNNYQIYSIYQALTTQNFQRDGKRDASNNRIEYDGDVYPTPFDFRGYFDTIKKKDRNQLLNINFGGQDFVLHPLFLFIVHYGYSMDIKRIISRYAIDDIEKMLMPTDKKIDQIAQEQNINKYVILPKGFTQRDAVFLYHYKYYQNVKNAVERIHNRIQANKTDESKVIRVDFWHKPTQLRVRGLRIGNKILCTSIVGISEPHGSEINVFLQPKKRVDINSDKDRAFSVVTKYLPPENIEELDFVRNPVNNIIQGVLKERLEKLSDLRTLKIHQTHVDINPIGDDTQFITYPEINGLSVGEKQGSKGDTGYANCFFEVKEDGTGMSRFKKVWEDAKKYANEIGGVAQWFTYQRGFNKDDNYFIMSLTNFHAPAYKLELPENVLVVRITTAKDTYFVLEFGEDKIGSKPKGYTGLVYKQAKDFDFINDENGLPDLLLKVIGQDGTIDSDFVNSYKGQLATFQHRPAKADGKGNNWVKNGVRKLL